MILNTHEQKKCRIVVRAHLNHILSYIFACITEKSKQCYKEVQVDVIFHCNAKWKLCSVLIWIYRNDFYGIESYKSQADAVEKILWILILQGPIWFKGFSIFWNRKKCRNKMSLYVKSRDLNLTRIEKTEIRNICRLVGQQENQKIFSLELCVCHSSFYRNDAKFSQSWT
jgi:hypothetical protein